VRTICAWCRCTIRDDGIPSDHDSHGMCEDCADRWEADLADLEEDIWARRALDGAPQSVIETLAEGSLLTVAAKVARNLVTDGPTPPGSRR
jgi:hypothetical protein